MAVHIGARGPGHLSRSGGFYPDASLALAFTEGRYRVGSGSGAGSDFASLPGLTVTRSSVGYAETTAGSLVQFASNVARITDKGLLVEEARTNLNIRSQDFNTAWTKSNVTLGALVAAPDGTVTGQTVTANAGASVKYQEIGPFAIASGSSYAYSFYVKAGTARYFYIDNFSGAGIWVAAVFDLLGGGSSATQTAVGATSGTLVSTSQVALGGGWYRLTLVSSLAAATAAPLFGFAGAATGNTFGADGTISVTAAGTESFVVWGAQYELGAFATSYIPTTSASATRAADVVSIGGTWTAPITLATETIPQGPVSGSAVRLVSLDDGTNNNRILAYWGTTSLASFLVDAGGVSQANLTGTAITANASSRIAGRTAGNDVQAAHNGTLMTADTVATMPTGINTLRLGGQQIGSVLGAQYLRKVLIYPRAFSDAELQAATL